MKNKYNVLLAGIAFLSSGTLFAADFGVELEWNTDNVQEVMDTMSEQRTAFGKLVESGEIKDMFVADSNIDGKPIKLLRFVIEADSQQEVTEKLANLPLFQKELIRIKNVRPLGSKWLDNTPVYNNYGVIFSWKNQIEPLEIDRVLGIDLQRVISLNQAGLVTSSYIDTQTLDNGTVRPVYSVSFLAKNAQHARELSKQFEAVNLGYATVEVQYLGHKLELAR
ncbi:hypothetical protein BIT28_14650 [Photobacterium proteolyticum]|uniref:Uncharacterized protein n=1 Tax=Photobacterium proteolyticum TaxID=1903952 RepID=A0A1Q9GVH2_9GAMM|nr:hypothetical protein [Photobacterium proteolyticum]OLQ79072.1 hypothetical protein BIT28_14650 [Photobacterium proteolyticum]